MEEQIRKKIKVIGEEVNRLEEEINKIDKLIDRINCRLKVLKGIFAKYDNSEGVRKYNLIKEKFNEFEMYTEEEKIEFFEKYNDIFTNQDVKLFCNFKKEYCLLLSGIEELSEIKKMTILELNKYESWLKKKYKKLQIKSRQEREL